MYGHRDFEYMLPSQIRASFLWAPYLANITEHMQRWYAPLIIVPPGTAPRAPCCAAMLHAEARFQKACGFWGPPYRANITEHIQRWCAPASVSPPPQKSERPAALWSCMLMLLLPQAGFLCAPYLANVTGHLQCCACAIRIDSNPQTEALA